MGIDEQSKGVRVYWPDSKTVTIEWNVYYDKTGASVSRFEGESGGETGETQTDTPNATEPLSPDITPSPSQPAPASQISAQLAPATTPDAESPSDTESVPETSKKR